MASQFKVAFLILLGQLVRGDQPPDARKKHLRLRLPEQAKHPDQIRDLIVAEDAVRLHVDPHVKAPGKQIHKAADLPRKRAQNRL